MQNSIFMVMPFSDAIAASAYKHSTKPVAEANGFSIQRADEIFSANPIFDDIVTAIEQSSIIVIDISGKNANCFYELGVSHTLKRNRTIMITHDDFKDVPFDVAHFRILRYENSIAGKGEYETNLANTLKSITSGLAELYYSEFEIIVDILVATDAESSVLAGMAITRVSRPLRTDSTLTVEGKVPGNKPVMAGASAKALYAPLIARKLVEVVDGNFSLTSKGTAFVKFAEERGFVIDCSNDEAFTEGHESFFQKARRNSQSKRLENDER